MKPQPCTTERSRAPWWPAGAVAALLALLAAQPSAAQLSPGRLARAHAALEGASHCLDCHAAGKGVDPGRCLECHSLLRQRIAEGKGLHAGSDYRPCHRCHIEHHGEGFELVFWGEAGTEGFDHRDVGYVLEGAHSRLACRSCHKPELIRQADLLRRHQKDLHRTYMGLETTCLSCHNDPHGEQFQDRGCTDCHDQTAWKPAPGFDHATTRYPLTGAHTRVACDRCHPAEATAGDGAGRLRYRGVTAEWCGDCHRDPHAGRLGRSCRSCHHTGSWNAGELESFEHDRTRYPLRGRHREAACRSCHRGGLLVRIAGYQRCRSCHADPHRGQLRQRPDGGACDSCHDLQGFSPPRYSVADHQQSRYPLEEAHLAVPCIACHRPLEAAALRSLPPAAPRLATSQQRGRVLQYRFPSTRCRECHGDPHAGALDRYMGADGCTACHDLGSWYTVRFDHGRTDFLLEGRHTQVGCRDCHPRVVLQGRRDQMLLSDLPLTCVGCHNDPHQGQLQPPGVDPRCTRCHTVDNWRASKFLHDRDSAFRLEGAHVRVPCADCHTTEILRDRPVVRYRPLPSSCAACHKDSILEAKR